MQISTRSGPRILAILGPTNTGKTHLAMERMLAHTSGMIGFPLRLLARENYDRAVARVGKGAVALITGEERIVPKSARYFLCTVEAMPVSKQVDFLGIDEIQMCADPERGHVFTDRLLHARGLSETMFMGAETIRPVIRKLIDNVEFDTRARFSTLAYNGSKKIQRLPGQSAIVTFSAQEVYAVAELVRRQKGGAAVVLGALSPRTRNAQVEMFQNGEVEHLIATDAIGMGLNLDLNHVAFAALHKFDGQFNRGLSAAEMAQIAGRAGRHMNDGTFGVTGNLSGIDPDIIEQIEAHEFEPLAKVFWRNARLDFRSVEALQKSLRRRSDNPTLVLTREPVDEVMLDHLSQNEDVARIASAPDRVQLLWEVCQIPDFRNIHTDTHPRLLTSIYRFLAKPNSKLPVDWLGEQVLRMDRYDGDIDQLSSRLAGIRVWTYVSHKHHWLEDANHWQDRTRAIEDKLSDVLHERLTQRFVDRRTSVLLKSLKDKSELMSTITANGEVQVEGEYVGRLEGFRFIADETDAAFEGKAIASAARRALTGEIAQRVKQLETDEDDKFAVNGQLEVLWNSSVVGGLKKGDTVLSPDIQVIDSEFFDGPARERVRTRLQNFINAHIEARLKMLTRLRDCQLPGPIRGLLFQLNEGLGCVPRSDLESLIKDLGDEDRKALAKLGVRLGVETVHVLDALKPDPVELRGILWAVARDLEALPELPPAGRTSVPNDRSNSKGFYLAAGYMPVGPLAARVDMLERFAALLRQKARENDGKVKPDPDLLSLLGCTVEQAEGVFTALGWRAEVVKVSKAELDAKEAVKTADAPVAAPAPEAAVTSEVAATADAPAETSVETPAETVATPVAKATDEVASASSEVSPLKEEAEQGGIAEAVAVDAAADAPAEAAADGEAESEFVEIKYFVRVDRRKRGGGNAGKGQRGPRQEARGKGAPKGKGGQRPNRGGPNKGGDRQGNGQARPANPAKNNQINEDSPFAKLKEMLAAKG
ncbi:helicase-related protein [Thalassospira alkalitolerans]|uniref:Disulfide oxidoreductase n=1 Tax=Thalassospira alkalitolerans TaxID=1293890 RepID=A0A1Y2L8W2_9PROT|nr:helicase-related protein [Thalassospira alkalitolerans]OSQ46823.1 disulfide oxidoreductase [Thalassospira alkalitolerans]